MKKFTRKLCAFLAIFTLTYVFISNLPTSAQTIEDPYANYIDDPYTEVTGDYIKGLTDRLNNFKPSGDVSIDYLYQEILLHRALLFTAYSIKQFTQNPELLDIADDIDEYYLGELRELRNSLPYVINQIKAENLKNDDTAYMKDYKDVINKMNKELSSINSNENTESTYIKQNIALLEAIELLSKNSLKYSNNTLTKNISDSIVKNTPTYTTILQTLQKSLK